MLGWYFAREDEKLGYGDGREVAVGVTHTVEGPVVLCSNGLHASERIIDALQYSGSAILYRVELSRDIDHGVNKSCAAERVYLERIDVEEILRKFARECALSVIHLWDAPQIILDYLRSGDESLRDTAWDAAWDAAGDAAWDAAGAAAGDAARDAALEAQTKQLGAILTTDFNS